LALTGLQDHENQVLLSDLAVHPILEGLDFQLALVDPVELAH
jgi:hypothetical protein